MGPFLAAAVTVVLLAACGGSGHTTSTATPKAAVAQTVASAAHQLLNAHTYSITYLSRITATGQNHTSEG